MENLHSKDIFQEKGNLPQQMYPLDSSATAFYNHQPQQNMPTTQEFNYLRLMDLVKVFLSSQHSVAMICKALFRWVSARILLKRLHFIQITFMFQINHPT
ncbi:unnamed protein product [Fraxinus pennsylvanica]|uniref:Uncharacterized protein n=1 Tax=Fraxinus pennsylvanica TaxID=56036 RepID=A0AAD1ZKK8_9LAMI|nr:unnamed protein product [Fraxinus pennsylvanica]